MKTHENNPGDYNERIVLKELVDLLLLSFQPVALKQHSLIVNEIQAGFQVSTDEHALAGVLSNLFGTLVKHCPHSTLVITARCYNDIVLLRIRSDSVVNARDAIRHMKAVRALAEKIGGSVNLINPGAKGSAVLFSFIRFNESSTVPGFNYRSKTYKSPTLKSNIPSA
jgi:hypothetical protein